MKEKRESLFLCLTSRIFFAACVGQQLKATTTNHYSRMLVLDTIGNKPRSFFSFLIREGEKEEIVTLVCDGWISPHITPSLSLVRSSFSLSLHLSLFPLSLSHSLFRRRRQEGTRKAFHVSLHSQSERVHGKRDFRGFDLLCA